MASHSSSMSITAQLVSSTDSPTFTAILQGPLEGLILLPAIYLLASVSRVSPDEALWPAAHALNPARNRLLTHTLWWGPPRGHAATEGSLWALCVDKQHHAP